MYIYLCPQSLTQVKVKLAVINIAEINKEISCVQKKDKNKRTPVRLRARI